MSDNIVQSIVVTCPGGLENLGERAIMHGTIANLRKYFPKAKISILGYQDLVKIDPSLHVTLGDNVRYEMSINARVTKAPKILEYLLKILFPRMILASKTSKLLISADLIIAKGQETATYSYGVKHFVDSIYEILVVNRLGLMQHVYGHSIGPIKWSILLPLILSKKNKYYLRDPSSYSLMKDLKYEKIDQVNDLAYYSVAEYLKNHPRKSTANKSALIVPNGAIVNTDNRDVYIANLKKIIRVLKSFDYKVFIGSSVLSSDWNNDYVLVNMIIGADASVKTFRPNSLYDLYAKLNQIDLVLSSRLHPIILSNGFDVRKIYTLSESPKIHGLMKKIGLEGNILAPFYDISDKELKAFEQKIK